MPRPNEPITHRIGPLVWMPGAGRWWFRVFGWGVSANAIKRYPLTFSERHGYARYVQVGGWAFRPLRPFKWRSE